MARIRVCALAFFFFLFAAQPAAALVVLAEDVGPTYPTAFQVVGETGYMAASWTPNFRVFDVSDPHAFVELGSLGGFSGPGWQRANNLEIVITQTSAIAYVATGWGSTDGEVVVLGISDLSNISLLATISDLDGVWGFDIEGDVMAITQPNQNGNKEFLLYDVSNPAAPVEKGGLGDFDSSYDYIDIEGTIAYLNGSTLRVIDISNLNAPVQIAELARSGEQIQIENGIAYSACAEGLCVIDVSTPSMPSVMAEFDLPGDSADQIQVVDQFAYVSRMFLNGTGSSDDEYTLHKVDISNPAAPVLLSSVERPNGLDSHWMLEVTAGYAYMQTYGGGEEGVAVISTSEALTGALNTPGLAQKVQVVKDKAYVADYAGGGLRIVDVSDPAAPTSLGALEGLGWVKDVAVSQEIAYLAAGTNDLKVVDVSDSAAPVEIGSLGGSGEGASGLDVVGDLLYVANGPPGLRVVDVSDPTTPTEISVFNPPGGGRVRDVDEVGGVVYAANAGDGLAIIDVRDPAAPVLLGVGQVDTPGDALAVKVVAGIAYVADSSGGLRVIDISPSASASEIADVALPGIATDVDVAGGLAYVSYSVYGMSPSGVRVIDVSNPASPVDLGDLEVPGTAQGVDYFCGRVYVAGGDLGLFIVDLDAAYVPDLNPLVEVGAVDTPYLARDVEVVDQIAYVADQNSGLQIFDLSDPTTPVALGALDTPGHALEVKTVDGLAYVADGAAGGLRVIDVSNPALPVELGALDTPGEGRGVFLQDGLAYVADGNHGLRILDVSHIDSANPADPIELGFLDTPDYAYRVFVEGTIAYVADQYSGLQIIDVTHPGAPTSLGVLDTPGAALDVRVANGLAYLADHSAGLRVIDVSNPALPVERGSLDTPGAAVDVSLVGTDVYVADYNAGLRAIDASDPDNLVETRDLITLSHARGVAAVGGVAYVAASTVGLRAIRLFSECDFDDDEVLDYVEYQCGNGGDGNNDGVPDAAQSAVVSLPGLEAGTCVTVDASQSSSCGGISLLPDVFVSQENASGGGDPQFDYPFGLIGFTVPCGGPLTVKLYFHGDGPLGSTYRMYGPTTPGDINTLAWYTFPSSGPGPWVSFSSELIGAETIPTVSLAFWDGQLGDSTGVDGQIVDLGGPVPEPGFGISLLSGLLMLRWLTQRRRYAGATPSGR